jgi:integrase/recombinase XerD
MSSDSPDPFDFDSADEQSDESEKTTQTENSGSTIDDVLDGQESDPTQGARGNDPEQYDLPHALAREWIAKRHDLRWSDRTVETYQSNVRIYLSYLRKKETTLLDAGFIDLLEFVEYRVKAGAARSTVATDCAVLEDLYRYLRIRTDAEPGIEPYEFDELNLSEYDYEGGFERGDIEPWEVKCLFQNFKHIRDHLMAYFAVATSVRNSDIRSLRLSDVDYDELEVHIPNPKNGDPYDVPMSRELASRLKQWEQTSREGYTTAESSPYIFPSRKGEKLMSNRAFNTHVVRAAERAGIQETIGTATALNSQNLRDEQHREIHRVTVHTLRHTCLTMAKKAGAPPEVLRKLANHKDIETTEDYTHDDEDEDKRWHDLIRDLLDF